MTNINLQELESLTHKIENNQANLADYQRYEALLLTGGLPQSYIDDSLRRTGFNNWSDFAAARKDKEKEKKIESAVIGGLVGLGLGILLAALFDKD